MFHLIGRRKLNQNNSFRSPVAEKRGNFSTSHQIATIILLYDWAHLVNIFKVRAFIFDLNIDYNVYCHTHLP